MRLALPLLALACVLLVSCQPIAPVPYDDRPLPTPDDGSVLRPDIPRSAPPDEPDEPEPLPVEPPRGGIIVPEDIVPRLSLEVPLGEPIGERHPLIDAGMFPLLRHRAIHLSPQRVVEYEEELRFDFGANSTGKVVFAQDRADGTLGTFLSFEEDKPIFEYRVRLRGSTWYELLGQEIQLLGHTYVVAEVTNESVAFFGRDVESNILFDDNRTLLVGNARRSNTRAHVDFDEVAFILFAQGRDARSSIMLAPGESLAEHVGRERLASMILDIRYEQPPATAASRAQLVRTDLGYRLVVGAGDEERIIPLVERVPGGIALGSAEQRLHVEECPYRSFCIQRGDLVALTQGDRTHVLQYSDASEKPNRLIMRAKDNRYDYEYLGTPGSGARTDIVVEDAEFTAWIGAADNATGDHNISVEMRRPGEIALPGGAYLVVHDIVANRTLPLELVVPRELSLDREDERIPINLTFDGDWKVVVGGIPFVERDDNDESEAQTAYGALLVLDKKRRSLASNEGAELEMLVPSEQLIARVRLEG